MFTSFTIARNQSVAPAGAGVFVDSIMLALLDHTRNMYFICILLYYFMESLDSKERKQMVQLTCKCGTSQHCYMDYKNVDC